MSSSLSNDERAERIAEIEKCLANGFYMDDDATLDLTWLIAELRSALQREAQTMQRIQRAYDVSIGEPELRSRLGDALRLHEIALMSRSLPSREE